MTFDYKISVIVPVYNAQEYLVDCLNSLIKQNFSNDEYEVILVDDGSTDDSADVCKDFCSKHNNFKYFYKDNSGVSETRNFGIKQSKGKYIMYLDSDDQLTKDTLKHLYDFFESVYDEVDLVTYFIQPYKNGANLKPHSRYKDVLTNTGVYDLEKYPYVIQTTMNICIKNKLDDNEYFNCDMTSQEDQEYINRILMDKLKIGYCAQACYLYNRDNESSCVASKFYSYYLFESAMEYFENLFDMYEDAVPKYFQAVFFHDLRWKLTSKILYPFHYDEQKFDNAMNRIKALLSRVDVDTIIKNPSIRPEHIHYWLSLKPNVFPMPFVDETSIDVIANGKTITHSKRPSIRLSKISMLDKGRFRFRGVVELPIYNYIDDEPELYVVENMTNRKKLDVFRSSFSYVATNIMTNKIYAFTYDVDPSEVKNFAFKIVIDSFDFDVHVMFMGNAVFKHGERRYMFARNNYLLHFYNESIIIEKKTKDEIYEFEKSQLENPNKETFVYDLKKEAIDYRYNHRVWLYSDLATVEKDNAYYQFINDFGKDDGVDRYYVYTKPYEQIEHLFTDEQKKNLVEFGSHEHQVLYLASEIIFTSFFGKSAITPFLNETEEYKYNDIEHFRVIYMQHGILHASYVSKYSAEKANCDKVVVSSYFEIDNFKSKYAYCDDELIKCGMPRYTKIRRDSKPLNRILLAPSWRSYFAANETANSYSVNIGSFTKSSYYTVFWEFLNDERLHSLLKNNNIILDIKMHPIIKDIVSDLFDVKCDNINIVKGDINLEDYNMFITDFSSFVFDFAYLNRPILYFVPDYEEFISGMNLYRELDLPFEDAFGNLVKCASDAYDEVERIVNNGFVVDEKFDQRMSNFYLPMNNCEEDIYNYVINNMLPSFE